jgi:protocatechuate 3,4-dioxygenase beta subunit
MHTVIMSLLAFGLIGLSLAADPSVFAEEQVGEYKCAPTQGDMLGPYYKQGAPVRDRVGEGYLLQGRVLSAEGCSPVEGARIEFWQAGSDGEYNDAYRATVLPNVNGEYRFETVFPAPYASRPPHIHIMVEAPEFERLVTQHYPERGTDSSLFDLVLIPTR